MLAGVLVMDEAFDCWEGGKNTNDYHVYFDQWWRRGELRVI
jgi:beta-galactosidase